MQTFRVKFYVKNKEMNLLQVKDVYLLQVKDVSKQLYEQEQMTSSSIFSAKENKKNLIKVMRQEKDYKPKYVKEFSQHVFLGHTFKNNENTLNINCSLNLLR